jgi:hypothetical protein
VPAATDPAGSFNEIALRTVFPEFLISKTPGPEPASIAARIEFANAVRTAVGCEIAIY